MAEVNGKIIAMPNIIWEMKKLPYCRRNITKKIDLYGNKWQFLFESIYSGNSKCCVNVSMSIIKTSYNCPEMTFRLRCGWLTESSVLMEQETRASFQDLVKNKKSIKIWEKDYSLLHATLHSIPFNAYYFFCRIEFDINLKLFKQISEELVPPVTPPCLLSLTADFKRLLDTSTMTDVVLKCGDKSIPAHKCILSSRSPVFKAMFQNDFKESVEGIVDITDIDPIVLQMLIDYIYTGNIDLSDVCVESACELFKAADKYCISLLKDKCVNFIKGNLEPHHASYVLLMSHVYGHKDLKTHVVSYLSKRREILISEDWRMFAEQNLALAQEVFLNYVKGK